MQQNEDILNLSRKIIISSPIDSNVAEKVVGQIMDINEFDNQMSVVSTYQPQPIEIYINSDGGSATDGFAIIGAMEMSETPIFTYGLGIVASMALGIFVKGDYRIAHRYTRFMYHSVAYGEMGYIQDHEDSLRESELIQYMYDDLFKETKITREKMDEIRKSKTNFFFSGKEAVTLGIADEVTKKPQKKVQLLTDEEFQTVQKELEKE
jgi:ATP-dependent Clp protease protease subunit